MWDYNNDDYTKFIKFLYKNLKMSDNFINKIIFGFWQKTDIYKTLIKEKERIMHDLYDYSLKENKILLLKWNQKYQIKYNEFLEKIKSSILDGDPNKTEKLRDLIKKNKIIKQQLTTELDSGIDININNSIKNIEKTVVVNYFKNNEDKNKKNIEIYDDGLELEVNTIKENQSKIQNKIKDIKIYDNIEIIKDKEKKNNSFEKIESNNEKNPIIKKNINNTDDVKEITQQNNKKINKSLNITENEFNNFGIDDLDDKLNKSIIQYNKDLKKYNKNLDNKKKYIANNPIIIDDKLPNFSKQIIKLKKLNIPSFDIIINDHEKIYIYKRNNCIIIKLNEEIKNEISLSLDGLNKVKKIDEKIIIPIKVIKTKK